MKQEFAPWGLFEMDDTTGLPVTPEGHFFRVRRTINPFWRVELRRKRRFWFSKVEEYAVSNLDDAPITKERIVASAAYVMWLYAKRRSRVQSDSTLLGDYPPKTLAESSNG